MRHRFLTADVFTTQRFAGNQLAVFPDARDIPEQYLLPIAREFNYSETTFVFPPANAAHTRRVRIFTPGNEIPFAGHPTVGTAHVLAAIGDIPLLAGAETKVVLEEGVGPVPVTIIADAAGMPNFAQLSVARLPETGPRPAISTLAAVLSLDLPDFMDGEYEPEPVSCGLPWLMVPLRTRAAVSRARVNMDVWERTIKGTMAAEVMVFAMDAEGPNVDVHARVFVPGLSVPEDPATGSANACLGGYLAARTPRDNGTLRWTVEQGIEMNRPSILHVEADKRDGKITGVRVGGSTVMVSEGSMEV